MFNRSITSLATVLLLVVQAVPAYALTDTNNTRYNDAFAYLGTKGAVSGYSDGSGRPYALINRAEALKTIVEMHPELKSRVSWYKSHMSSLPLFLDYRQSDWFAPYVETGFEASLVTGYQNRTFRPELPIKLEEALALLFRSYDSEGQSGGVWYDPYVQQAIAKNIAYAGERHQIGKYITRGQFFDLVYRLDKVESQNLIAFVDPTPPPVTKAPVINRAPAQNPRPIALATPGTAPAASGKAFSITIPRLGVTDLTVTHPTDALTSKGLLSVLKDGVGHLFSYPGKGGKIMIYGHSSSYSWDVSQFTKIFRRVNELKAGDRVYVTYEGTVYEYEVTGQQTIAPNDIAPFRGRGEELILYTCWPPDSIKQRLIVRATPVSTVAQR